MGAAVQAGVLAGDVKDEICEWRLCQGQSTAAEMRRPAKHCGETDRQTDRQRQEGGKKLQERVRMREGG